MDTVRDLLSDVPNVVVEYERPVGPVYRGEALAPRSRSNPVLIETDHLRGSYRVEFTVIGDAAPRLLPSGADISHVRTLNVDLSSDAEPPLVPRAGSPSMEVSTRENGKRRPAAITATSTSNSTRMPRTLNTHEVEGISQESFSAVRYTVAMTNSLLHSIEVLTWPLQNREK